MREIFFSVIHNVVLCPKILCAQADGFFLLWAAAQCFVGGGMAWAVWGESLRSECCNPLGDHFTKKPPEELWNPRHEMQWGVKRSKSQINNRDAAAQECALGVVRGGGKLTKSHLPKALYSVDVHEEALRSTHSRGQKKRKTSVTLRCCSPALSHVRLKNFSAHSCPTLSPLVRILSHPWIDRPSPQVTSKKVFGCSSLT